MQRGLRFSLTNAPEVDTDDEKTLFVSTFSNMLDAEIVAVISAWLSNGLKDECHVIKNTINDIMLGIPHTFVFEYHKADENIYGNGCFYGNLTFTHFHNLLSAISTTIISSSSLQAHYLKCCASHRKKNKYTHDIFAFMLGGNTGFPSTKTSCSFYRYNLLFYWLVYKLRIWENIDSSAALLPCNDKIFANAYKMGITDTIFRSNLTNTIKLTEIARSAFGNEHFYKMYELLNFFKDE